MPLARKRESRPRPDIHTSRHTRLLYIDIDIYLRVVEAGDLLLVHAALLVLLAAPARALGIGLDLGKRKQRGVAVR